ncbi:hypothetical protein AEQ63_13960 [Pseudomonas sp. RIT-PI-o]|nr:hypothetical protein AEQ63_13960 [Pseudomonas sp. RIT-PI-o]
MQRRQSMNNSNTANKVFMEVFGDNRSLKDALYLLKSDWPRAAALISVAAALLKAPETTHVTKAVIQTALESYLANVGATDRQRLAAFMDPFIDGMCEIVGDKELVNKSSIVSDEIARIMNDADYEGDFCDRTSVTKALLQPQNPLSKVWTLIESGRK